MRKLNLEHLEVESFETSGAPIARGTVNAHVTLPFACGPGTDPPNCDTDELSCGGTCGPSACAGNNTCVNTCGCTVGVTCAATCSCQTVGITCQQSAPSPYGTCCGLTC